MRTEPKVRVFKTEDGFWVVDVETEPDDEEGPNGPLIRVWVNDDLVFDGTGKGENK